MPSRSEFKPYAMTASATIASIVGAAVSAADAPWLAPVVGGALNVLSGTLSNLIASRLEGDKAISDALSKTLQNEDLARAAARALKYSITMYKGGDAASLEKLADDAEAYWLKLQADKDPRFQAYAEENLVARLTEILTSNGQVPLVNIGVWREFLANISSTAIGQKGAKRINIEEVAGVVWREFPTRLYAEFKHDLETGGAAFAGITLRLLCHLVNALSEIQKSQDRGNIGLIAQRFDTLTDIVLLQCQDVLTTFDKRSAEIYRSLRDFRGENLKEHRVTQARLDELKNLFLSQSLTLGRSPGSAIPYRLNPWFSGRESLIKQLQERSQRRSGTKPVVIVGLGGIGKTQLAAEHAHAVRQDFAVFLWAKARSARDLENELARLAGVEGLDLDLDEDVHTEQRCMNVQRWLRAHTGWMLVVDNADEDDIIPAIDHLAAEWLNGHVVITSRTKENWPADFDILEPPPLPEAAATNFLLRRTFNLVDTAAIGEEERAHARLLAKRLAYMPLALEQAGAFLFDQIRRKARDIRDFTGYLNALNTRKYELFSKTTTGMTGYEEPIVSTWDLSLQKCDADTQDLFLFCSLCADRSLSRGILDRFVRAREEFRLRDATRARQKETPRLRPDEIRRLTDAHIAALTNYSLLLAVKDEVDRHPLVAEVTRETSSADERDRVMRGAVTALQKEAYKDGKTGFIRRDWNAETSTALHAESILIEAEKLNIDGKALGLLANFAGDYRVHSRNFNLALRHYLVCKREYEICYKSTNPETDKHPKVAEALDCIANCYNSLGQQEQAITLYREAYEILGHYSPYTTKLPVVCLHLGDLLRKRGRFKESEFYLKRALSIRTKVKRANPGAIARCWRDLSGLYRSMGHYDRALHYAKDALATHEQASKPVIREIAADYYHLASIFHSMGKCEEAERALRKSLDLRLTLHGRQHAAIGNALGLLGNILRVAQRYGESQSAYEEALTIFAVQVGTKHEAYGRCQAAYGYLLALKDGFDAAIHQMESGIAILESARMPDNSLIGRAYIWFSDLYLRKGDRATALIHGRKAAKLLTDNFGRDHRNSRDALEHLARLE